MLCVGLNARSVNGKGRVVTSLCGAQTFLTGTTYWVQRTLRLLYGFLQFLSCYLTIVWVWIRQTILENSIGTYPLSTTDSVVSSQCDGSLNSVFQDFLRLVNPPIHRIRTFSLFAKSRLEYRCGDLYVKQWLILSLKLTSFTSVLCIKSWSLLQHLSISNRPTAVNRCGAFSHTVLLIWFLLALPIQVLGRAIISASTEGYLPKSRSLSAQSPYPKPLLGSRPETSNLYPVERITQENTKLFSSDTSGIIPSVAPDSHGTPSAITLGSHTKAHLPVAFIIVVASVILVALLLFLAFWCVYRRQERQKAAALKQGTTSSFECIGIRGTTLQESLSQARIVTEPGDTVGNEHSVAPEKKSRISYMCCCFPYSSQTPLCHDTSAIESAVSLEGNKSLDGLRKPEHECAETVPPIKCEDVGERISSSASASPSLAARRRVAPPPRLVSALPSILSLSPLIETRTVQVQPFEIAHFSTVTKAAFGSTSSATDVKNRQDSFTLTHVNSKSQPNGMPLSSDKNVYCEPSTVSDSAQVSVDANQCASVPTHPLRHRTRGLLESRRGSHTSLTLCLSPCVDSIVGTGLSSITTPSAGRGVSLDEETNRTQTPNSRLVGLTVCEPTTLCYSAHTTGSNDTTGEYFDSSLPQLSATCGQVRCNLKSVHSVMDHVSLDSPATELPSESGTASRDTLVTLLQRHQYHSHHHYLHHRHLHYRPAHPHHRLEIGHPCPHNSLSQQRSREVEQLLNASQPLTYDQLASKLRDNASSLFQEFWDIPMNHPSKKELPIAGIGQKNRYQSILPNFSTRVILPMLNNDPATTYINANYIHGYGGQANAFIATQGPMSHTIGDFWRMVWHSQAPAIVMITKLVEQQVVKCELYLPNSVPDTGVSFTLFGTTPSSTTSNRTSSSLTGSPFSSDSPSLSESSSAPRSTQVIRSTHPLDSGVTSMDETSLSEPPEASKSAKFVDLMSPDPSHQFSLPGCAQTYGDIFVRVDSLERFEGYSVRTLTLQRNSEERKVEHFWYTAWPDHSSPDTTPASARQLLQLVNAAEACRRHSPLFPSAASGDSSATPCDPIEPVVTGSSTDVKANATSPSVGTCNFDGPIVVHCSAGVGRTGCFIALCIGCAQLQREGVVDILRIVSRLRLDRGGMVQRNEQYEFIHHALLELPAYRDTQRQRADDRQTSGIT